MFGKQEISAVLKKKFAELNTIYDVHQTFLSVINLVIHLWTTKQTEPMLII